MHHNQSDLTRTRYGNKRLTKGAMAALVIKFKRAGMTHREIADTIGIKDEGDIRKYEIMGLEWGMDQKRNIGGDFRVGIDPFDKNPHVIEWVKSLKTRKQGEPITNAPGLYRSFKVLCESVKLNPSELLMGNTPEILKAGENAVMEFIVLYNNRKSTNLEFKAESQKGVAKQYSAPVRDFLRTHGYSYPPKITGVMSGAKVAHGEYADVHISDKQYAQIQTWVAENYSVDSDIMRWLALGIEGVSRPGAAFEAKPNFNPMQAKDGTKMFSMEIYEKKTQEFWPRYIYTNMGRESITAARDNKSEYCISERNKARAKKTTYDAIQSAIKACDIQLNENGQKYIKKRPGHALRHFGAQIWLVRTKWNYALVAAMGWNTLDELKASYGKMPAEIRGELMLKLDYKGAAT